MVGGDEGCVQPGSVSLPSVASHSSPWRQGVSCADVDSLTVSYILPEESLFGTYGNSFRKNELLPGFSDLTPFSSTVTSGPDFDTTASFSPHPEHSAELGPYGVYWPSQISGLGSVGQYLTFSAQDGSQKKLEFVSLSPQGIEPWNIAFGSAPLNTKSQLTYEGPTTIGPHLDSISSKVLSTPSGTSSSQLFTPSGSGLGAASPDLSSTTFDHTVQTSKLDVASGSFQCSFCMKIFDRRYRLK
jgi:hypothetical protein